MPDVNPDEPLPRLGFIGAGAMGGPMARNLIRSGYTVLAFDRDESRLTAVEATGSLRAGSLEEVVLNSDVVFASLPSSDAFVRAADASLLPAAQPGQVIIDTGTTTPPETRRLAAEFRRRGAFLIDAPVSGGIGGAERAALLMFMGGDPDICERCRPVLEKIADPERITYCGPSGSGQVVKGVNQLAMGLSAAACLEAVAFGVLAGVDAVTIARAIAGPEPWRTTMVRTAEMAAAGKAEEIRVKFRELPYFLREALDGGFTLPLTELLYNLCDAGERVAIDDNRPAPAYWHRLQSIAAASKGMQDADGNN